MRREVGLKEFLVPAGPGSRILLTPLQPLKLNRSERKLSMVTNFGRLGRLYVTAAS